jgi:LysR family transcriptional regulator (chromosome initiation inhibitor)
MPVVVFNDKDTLQHDLLRTHGVDSPPLLHRVPTSADFLEAVRLGLGWGAVPEPQLRPALDDGSLVALGSRGHVDVPLFWQRWRIDSPTLDRLSDAVRRRAAAHLRPGPRPQAS